MSENAILYSDCLTLHTSVFPKNACDKGKPLCVSALLEDSDLKYFLPCCPSHLLFWMQAKNAKNKAHFQHDFSSIFRTQTHQWQLSKRTSQTPARHKHKGQLQHGVVHRRMGWNESLRNIWGHASVISRRCGLLLFLFASLIPKIYGRTMAY